MADKVAPNDPRYQYKTANLNGITYGYMLAEPKGTPTGTIFLIHGFPDMSFGWRYQIPFLLSLGLRVVCPDMMGYGGTDAPEEPKYYTYKRAADDMAELAKQLGSSTIILGGHDWGGAVVYRIAMRYPKLISALFSVCTPFFPPQEKFVPLTAAPNFKYQLQFQGSELEDAIVGEEKCRQFLNALYGGRTPDGQLGFDVSVGAKIDLLPTLGHTPLLSKEELDFYAKQYAIHGMHGPLSWYRTGEINFADERDFVDFDNVVGKFDMPTLYIAGKRDSALPPKMSEGMERWFRSLTKGEVNAGHWALWEQSEAVNRYLREFLAGQISGLKANL
ncbi:hypothetical protein BP5796_09899 [Coleophoma crateriformis]|uniref:AB hydrolase-1 domain-containing protein n=1 Tax=Coleophoma crateriformis TaxID=565419 RepID=A0A3D8QTV5_9HELO|nr:hypothetical protein BP5796_09899 [Coleophoma crateriformis]